MSVRDVTIHDIIQNIAELPDRTSPDDWPDAMLVTPTELEGILRNHLLVAAQPAEPALEETANFVNRCIQFHCDSLANATSEDIAEHARACDWVARAARRTS